jgi:predicted Zn-dependent protease
MRPAVLALLACLIAPTAAWAQFPGYGDLARTTALTAADDYRIGKGYVDMMSWMWGEVDDPELTAWVEDVARRIVAHSDRPDLVFNIRVVNDPSVNASALPGGFMIVNRGLVDALTPDQVAFVIAHEISHVQLRHFATTMNMTQAMEVMNTGLANMEAGGRQAVGDAQAELARTMTAYGRHLELESDLYGMLYALRAGFPSDAGQGAMARMRDVVGEVPPEMADVSSHPKFSERIEQLGKGLETIRETWGLFDAGVSYARAGEYDACVTSFQQFLTLFPKSSAAWSNVGTCTLRDALQGFKDDPWHDDLPVYTQADVTVRAGADKAGLARAKDAFGKALAIDPNRDAALANLGVLARLEGDLDGAEALLDKARELDPDYPGYMNNLGNVFASKKDWKKADAWYDKALKADPSARYALANRAQAMVLRGKGKQSVPLWEQLEADPKYGEQAFDQLVALGQRDASKRPPKAAPEPEPETSLVALLGALLGEGGGSLGDVLTEGEPEPAPQADPVPLGGATGKDAELGTLKLGDGPDAFKAVLGEPDFEDSQEDGYYRFVMWSSMGASVVFVDDTATSIELYPPCASKTGQGIGLGSTEEAVRAAYGDQAEVYGDPNSGYWTLSYEQRGTSFFFGDSGAVESFAIWAM